MRFLCSPFELGPGHAEAEMAAMRRLLDDLVAKGLPFQRQPDGARRFDLAELVNFIKYAHHAWGEPVWLERGVATMRRLAWQDGSEASRGQDELALPPDLATHMARPHTVTITRRFDRELLPRGRALRLHMPKPLNAVPGSHQAVWLRCDGVTQPAEDDGSRYSVKVSADGQSDIVLTLRHVFIPGAISHPSETPDAIAELYLRRREGLIVVTPQIEALAHRLSLSADDKWRSLRRIWDYLFDDISFGFIHYERLDPADPLAWGLAHRRMDCRTGSALIVALCRASGIAARMVHGYTLHPLLPTSHTWAEVCFGDDGWRPFDTYAIDLAGGRRDSPWRHHFFGQIDDRFVAERPPLQFCGLGTPRLPASWQLATALTDDGATTWFHALDSFALIYSETVSVALT